MFTYDSKKQEVKKKFVSFSQIFSFLNVFKIVNHHNNLLLHEVKLSHLCD